MATQQPAYTAPVSGVVPAGPPVVRPTVLRVAWYAMLAAVLVAVVGAVVVFATGRDFVEHAGSAYLTEHAAGAFDHADAVDTAYGLLVNRAVLDLVAIGFALLFAVFARNGATWARVLVTLVLLLSDTTRLTTLGTGPTGFTVTTVLLVVLSLAIPTLLFLPAAGRYAKARKAARRATRTA